MRRVSLVPAVFFTLAALCAAHTPASAADATTPQTPPAAPLVNLTPPQQQKLTALHTASHAQSDQLYTQLQQVTGQLYQLYGSYDFDVREARRLNQEINHIQSQLLDLRLSEQQQLRDILSPDQFAQLEAGMHPHGTWDDSSPDTHNHRHGHGPWPPSGGQAP